MSGFLPPFSFPSSADMGSPLPAPWLLCSSAAPPGQGEPRGAGTASPCTPRASAQGSAQSRCSWRGKVLPPPDREGLERQESQPESQASDWSPCDPEQGISSPQASISLSKNRNNNSHLPELLLWLAMMSEGKRSAVCRRSSINASGD